jgi:hypothetical protein
LVSFSFSFAGGVVVPPGFAGVVVPPQPMPTVTNAPRTNAAMILFTVEPSFREDIQTRIPRIPSQSGLSRKPAFFFAPKLHNSSEWIVVSYDPSGMVPHAKLGHHGFLSSFGGGVVSDFGGIPESVFGGVDGGVVLGGVVVDFPVGVLGPQPTANKPVTTHKATSFLTIAPSFLVDSSKGLAAIRPIAGDSSIRMRRGSDYSRGARLLTSPEFDPTQAHQNRWRFFTLAPALRL